MIIYIDCNRSYQRRLVTLQAPRKIFSTKLVSWPLLVLSECNCNSRDISVTAWVENDN